MTVAAPPAYEVAGRTVVMPVGVGDALAATAAFVVPAREVALLLPEGLRPVVVAPGRSLLNLSAIHYRRNDLGEYRELSIAFVVRHGLRTGTFIHRLPVDDDFSRAAGHGIWGFPKTVEPLDIIERPGEIAGRWEQDGHTMVGLTVRAGGTLSLPVSEQRAYTVIDGRVHVTRFLMRATGARINRGGATVELGEGPAADELRALGLPKPALFSIAMQRMQASFEAPTPIS